MAFLKNGGGEEGGDDEGGQENDKRLLIDELALAAGKNRKNRTVQWNLINLCQSPYSLPSLSLNEYPVELYCTIHSYTWNKQTRPIHSLAWASLMTFVYEWWTTYVPRIDDCVCCTLPSIKRSRQIPFERGTPSKFSLSSRCSFVHRICPPLALLLLFAHLRWIAQAVRYSVKVRELYVPLPILSGKMYFGVLS